MLERMRDLFATPMRWSIVPHLIAGVGAIAGFQIVKGRLDASYAASQHPVDYATGQTGFSADLVRGYYAHMEAAGTLPIYVQTQLIDFAFIVFFAATGWMLGTLIARISQPATWGRKLGLWGGGAIVFAMLMDCTENLVSFVMLADPQGFPAILAVIYSGFAVTKFASVTLGMVLILASLVFGLFALGRRLISR